MEGFLAFTQASDYELQISIAYQLSRIESENE